MLTFYLSCSCVLDIKIVNCANKQNIIGEGEASSLSQRVLTFPLRRIAVIIVGNRHIDSITWYTVLNWKDMRVYIGNMRQQLPYPSRSTMTLDTQTEGRLSHKRQIIEEVLIRPPPFSARSLARSLSELAECNMSI